MMEGLALMAGRKKMRHHHPAHTHTHTLRLQHVMEV